MSGAATTGPKELLAYSALQAMTTCAWLLTSRVSSGGLAGIRAGKSFELQFDELSADHLGERRIEVNILLLGKLDIKGALN